MSLLTRLMQRLPRRTASRFSAPVARRPVTTLAPTSIYMPQRAPVSEHPDTKLVMDAWHIYREHQPQLSWADFIHGLEACRRAEAQLRAQYEAELAALQHFTRFKP
jgi:hypothetical protein